MKTAILYELLHHGNTKKLCDAIKKEYDVILLNVKEEDIALEEYDLCVFRNIRTANPETSGHETGSIRTLCRLN